MRPLIALVAALALPVPTVLAEDAPVAAAEQPAPPDAATTTAARPARSIQEIIVTAQKREENIRDVPISISVLDGDFIAQQSITDFRDIAFAVPNAKIDNTGEFNDVRIRGFGSPLSNKAFEQSVGLVIDGIPYGRREYFLGPVFDLERVEVLRGPQGTLFGRNTTAGLFNIINKRPSDELTGFLAAEYGELNRQHFSGAIGGPLVRNFLNFRLSALAEKRDGYIENTTAGSSTFADERTSARDRKGIRAQLGFPDLFGANLVLSYEHVEVDLGVGAWEFRHVNDNVKPFFRQWDPRADFEPFDHVGSVSHTAHFLQQFDTVVANASYDVGDWTLYAVAGHAILDEHTTTGDPDFTPAPMFTTSDKDENPQTTFELRANSPSLGGLFGLESLFGYGLGSSDLTAGFFYQRREINGSVRPIGLNVPALAQFLLAQGVPLNVVGGLPKLTLFPPGVILPLDPATTQAIFNSGLGFEETTGFFEQSGNAYAGFGHLNWRFLERWTLQYGMRITHEDKTATNSRATTEGTGVAFSALGLEPFTQTLSRSEFAFTPKVGTTYDWTDDVNFYATWAKGFKSGGFNELASNNDDLSNLVFDREDTTSWELGTKLRLLDGTAGVNVALYRQNATDLQVFTVQPSTALVSVTNAGEARSQGAEVDATWLATDWLKIRGNLAFTDAKYLEFPFGDCTSDRTDTDGDGDPRCDLSGEPLYRTPKWMTGVTPSVRVPLSSVTGGSSLIPSSAGGVDLVGALTVYWQDTEFVDRTNDPRNRQPSFFRLSGNLGFQNVEQGWSLKVAVENLTDEATVTQAREVTLGPGNFVQILEPPRLVFGSFRWSF